MTTSRTLSIFLVATLLAASANAQQFERLVSTSAQGRLVDLPAAYNGYAPTYDTYAPAYNSAAYNSAAYNGYAPAYPNYASSYNGQAVVPVSYSYAPAQYPYPVSAATTANYPPAAIQSGGCYAGTPYSGSPGYPGYTTGYPYQVVQSPIPTAAAYPYWTANPSYGRPYTDQYVGRNLFGQPTGFDRDQPVRNIFRWLLP